MRSLAEARVLLFEGGHVGAQDEVSVGRNSIDRRAHLRLDGDVLGFQINER